MTITPQSYSVAAVQLTSGERVDDNLKQARHWVAKAAESGAMLVVLPEFFALLARDEQTKVRIAETFGDGLLQSFLAELAREYGIWLVGGTIPLRACQPHKVRNATLVMSPAGECIARYDKVHLFGFGDQQEHYDESATIEAGDQIACVDTPLGRIGVGICYDLRFPEFFRAMGELNLLVLPAAFTYTTGQAHWEILLRARAIENQCYVLASAQGGDHACGRKTWGHSLLCNPWGEIEACALQAGEALVSGQVDFALIERVRHCLPALQHRRWSVGTAASDPA